MQGLDRGLHIRDGGRHQGRQADELCAGLAHGLYDTLGVNVAPEVEHVIAVVFEDDTDNVLADVMHVALDCGNDDLALAALRLAGGGNFGLDGLERSLRGGGGLQKLRQEYRAFLKTVAYGVQCGNQRDIHYVQRFAHCQRGVRGGAGLGLQAAAHSLKQGVPARCGGADLSHGGGGPARLRRLDLHIGIGGNVVGAL